MSESSRGRLILRGLKRFPELFGAGSSFDITGSTKHYHTGRLALQKSMECPPELLDSQALSSDWESVGDDLAQAMGYEEEN